MNSFKTWIAAALLSLAFMYGSASAAGFEMSVGLWNQDPNGDISYKALSALDKLSVKDDLMYDEDTKVFGRMKIDAPGVFPGIYLMATPMKFSGKGSKNVTFKFGNVTFSGDVPFSSELELDHYDIGLYYGIPGLKTATRGVLNMDLGIDARIIDFKARITGQDSITELVISESESVTVPIPMLYLGIQVKPFKFLAIEGEGRGIAYSSGNQYYDIIGRVKLKPLGPVFAAVGYRYEKVKFDEYDVIADVNFGGLFGEAGVEF